MNNIHIRELEEKDLNAVEEILNLYWGGDLKDHFFKRVKEYETLYNQCLREKGI